MIAQATADPTLLEAVLRRDRALVGAGLLILTVLAWAWVLSGAGTNVGLTIPCSVPNAPIASGVDSMSGMPGMTSSEMSGMADRMLTPQVWTADYAGLMVSMWWIMMIAMMLPSTTPVLLLFARVNRKEKAGGRPYVPTGVFALGYLAVWAGFSVLATALQWELQRIGVLSSMMVATGTWLAAVILVAAGAWQLTPIKSMCLQHCRSPISFLVHGWRPGRLGAIRMGLKHGLFCLGCCWFLMGLLFVGGIMNLYWIVGLAAFVLMEKTVPRGHWVGRIAGVGLLAWGLALVAIHLTGSPT